MMDQRKTILEILGAGLSEKGSARKMRSVKDCSKYLFEPSEILKFVAPISEQELTKITAKTPKKKWMKAEIGWEDFFESDVFSDC